MKNYLFNLAILLIIPFVVGINRSANLKTLEIGEKAPMSKHKMKSVSNEEVSLSTLKKEKGLLVIFSCNTCPFVIGNDNMDGWENRYNETYKQCEQNQIGMVLINSNEAKRDRGDSFKDMQEHSIKNKYNSNYVIDKNHQVADAFGASTTPHVFLFNSELKLVYKGAIDDNVKSKKNVKEKWLEIAINSLAKGDKIANAETRNSGCSIKRM